MSRVKIETLDEQYEKLSFIGSVRPLPSRSWFWRADDAHCFYKWDQILRVGSLGVFTPQPQGGLKGKLFFFNSIEVLCVFDAAPSELDVKQAKLGEYFLNLRNFELAFDPQKGATDTEEELFWSTLEAPILEN